MPDSLAGRQDGIDTALRSLREERRRLNRLGLDLPLARCHHETRYWNFLSALFTLPSRSATNTGGGDLPCPDARVP
jgi:hypothetical protein